MPRVSLRASGETRRWPAAEQAARGGRPGGEQSRRRDAALPRTRTRYREPRTSPSLPASLAFSAPFARHEPGKLEPWGRDRSRRTTCSRHGHRPRRAPGGLLPSPAPGPGQAPGSQPAARRAATLIPGNSNSRRVGLGRTATVLPTRFLDIRSLCSPRLREGLVGSGVGRISAVKRALGSQSCPLLRSGSPFGQWNGVGRTAAGDGHWRWRNLQSHSSPLPSSPLGAGERPQRTPATSPNRSGFGKTHPSRSREPCAACTLLPQSVPWQAHHRRCWLALEACARDCWPPSPLQVSPGRVQTPRIPRWWQHQPASSGFLAFPKRAPRVAASVLRADGD